MAKEKLNGHLPLQGTTIDEAWSKEQGAKEIEQRAQSKGLSDGAGSITPAFMLGAGATIQLPSPALPSLHLPGLNTCGFRFPRLLPGRGIPVSFKLQRSIIVVAKTLPQKSLLQNRGDGLEKCETLVIKKFYLLTKK